MKNDCFYFFFFLSILFISLNTLTTSADAGECHRVDGSLVIDQTDEDKETPLSVNGTDFGNDTCEEEPNFYKLQIYKVLLCTKDPYVPNGNLPILNRCVTTIIDRGIAGDPMNMIIEPGEEFDMLDGADLLLPVNKYTHAAIISSSVIWIKHFETFVIANGNDYTMQGYKNHASQYSTGPTCWSKIDKATTYTNSPVSSSSNGIHSINATWIDSESKSLSISNQSTDNPKALSLVCGATPDANYGYSAEILDSLDDRVDGTEKCGEGSHEADHLLCEVTFGNYQNYEGVLGTTGGDLAAFNLLQNDLSLATNKNNATKLLYVISFENPLDINEQTTGLKISVSTTSAVSFDVHQDDNAGNGNVQAKKLGANPFGVIFQTKTKRSRGAWR